MEIFLSLLCVAATLYGFSKFKPGDWEKYARGKEIAAATPTMVWLNSVFAISFAIVFFGLNFLALTEQFEATEELFPYIFTAIALVAFAVIAVFILQTRYVGYLLDRDLIKDFRYSLLLPLWALIMAGFFGVELLKANWAWAQEYRLTQMTARRQRPERYFPAEKVTSADMQSASDSEILPEILPENETGLLGN